MREKQDRAGKFFLKERGGVWYIRWYDTATRQTTGISTGLTDRDAARTALLEHAVAADRPKVDTDAQLASVLQTYYIHYAKNLPSAHVQRAAMADALRIWGDVNISALDRRAQLKFVETLRERELSDWTIQGRLTRVWAAMNWYHRDHVTLVVPPMISAGDWKPLLENNDHVYSVEELASLFNACEPVDARYSRDHWWRFLVLAIATSSRVTALLELKWDQVDLTVGRIQLNPEGRRQTKKRRAKVPICPTLAAELANWQRQDAQLDSDGEQRQKNLITYYGQRLTTREFYDTLAEAAGVTGGPNVIRHTVRTWLAEMGVPDAEADLFMGHKDDGSATGARYKHRRPEYLLSVSQALEALFAAIQEHVRRPFAGRALEDQPLPASSEGPIYTVERETRLELATCSLATNCSTTELLPRSNCVSETSQLFDSAKGTETLARTRDPK